MKKIAIACDHAGYEMKECLVGFLSSLGYEVYDFGCNSAESIDYPDFAHPLADSVESGEFKIGIGLCGSGQGMAMTLNKHQGIRAALCWNEELAALARRHNDSNVLVMPARFLDNCEAEAIVKVWLDTPFEGGRHTPRVEKIALK